MLKKLLTYNLIFFFFNLNINFLFNYLTILFIICLFFNIIFIKNYKYNNFYIKIYALLMHIKYIHIYLYVVIKKKLKFNFFFKTLSKNFINLLNLYKWNPLIKQYSYYGYYKSNINHYNINYTEELKKFKF